MVAISRQVQANQFLAGINTVYLIHEKRNFCFSSTKLPLLLATKSGFQFCMFLIIDKEAKSQFNDRNIAFQVNF